MDVISIFEELAKIPSPSLGEYQVSQKIILILRVGLITASSLWVAARAAARLLVSCPGAGMSIRAPRPGTARRGLLSKIPKGV